MRKAMLAVLAIALLVAVPAVAELQNVQIGGSIRIRANYYTNVVPEPTGSQVIWPGFFLPKRSIGTPGNTIATSLLASDEGTHGLDYVEQRTTLSVRADFTNEVVAFIELDSYDIWSEDFRSDYLTGADGAAASVDDVEVYQAYIEANEMFGQPLRLRVGRQEIALGSQWLVGVNDASSGFWGLSFDGVRLTYATDMFSIDAFAAQLFEGGIVEEDDSVWMYGVYGSYLGLEDITIDAYWLYVRDARSLNDTNFIAPIEFLEDIFGLDDYDATELHTFGLRGAGMIGPVDFEAEVAYQTGEADQVGFLFKPFVYGDDDADFDAWGANLEVGYNLDVAWQPRIYVGGAVFSGEDERDLTFWQWVNPFYQPEASVSFNRLFSNWEYSEFLANTDMSNMYLVRAGVELAPTESIDVLLSAAYFWAYESFDSPVHVNIGGFKVPIAPGLSFWTDENDDNLGLELGLYVTYHYTEDLSFEVGWAHFFAEDGISDGNFTALNGLAFVGGQDDEDMDYVYAETRIAF